MFLPEALARAIAAIAAVSMLSLRGLTGLAAGPPIVIVPLSTTPDGTDGVTPSAGELATLTRQLRTGLEKTPLDVTIAADAAGACSDSQCARRIGHAAGARIAVFGAVRRVTGIIWSTEASAVDVRSGKVLHTLQYSALGDYLVMMQGARTLGTCLGRLIAAKSACPTNRQGGWDVPMR